MSKVGAVQLQDVQGDVVTSLEAVQQYMTQADEENVDILCFPECFLQGYTLDKQETKERAFDLSSPEFKDVLQELEAYNVTIVLGMITREGDDFYNTAVLIRHGAVLGYYRKVHLFEDNFTPGQQRPVFQVGDTTIGINICYDARFSDGANALAEQGAKIIFYPLNNRLPTEKAAMYRDKHIQNLIERAKETGCWVVSSDVVAEDDEYASYGCSAIVDPEGNVVASVEERKLGMVTFTCD